MIAEPKLEPDADSDAHAATRKGDWIQTATGKQFWPIDPRPEEIFIEDVGHALANLCRYNGHTTKFYSVAQHSVLVSLHCPAEHALWGLLHDAAEAYVTDLPRPVKRHMPDYKAVEERVERAVAQRFGLSWPMPDTVKEVDGRILWDERDQLMAKPPRPWRMYGPPLGLKIVPLTPHEAQASFMSRFERLSRKA